MTVLGIDYGVKKMGYAVGDCKTQVVTPLYTIVSVQYHRHLTHIITLIHHWSIRDIVCSQPQGPISNRAVEFFCFIKNNLTSIRCHQYDEHMSTLISKRLYAYNRSLGAKKQSFIDHYAAAVMLEDWIDSNKV